MFQVEYVEIFFTPELCQKVIDAIRKSSHHAALHLFLPFEFNP